MSKVYLVNIGANMAHASRAKSPLHDDGSFIYVPYFYDEQGADGYAAYLEEARPYVYKEKLQNHATHNDPDWENLTYGDCCGRRSPRGLALRKVVEDDILLFWALLWRNRGDSWADFTDERHWCFIGALRVREILKPGQRPNDATVGRQTRAGQNAHFWGEKLETDHFVFVGCTKHSCKFTRAVDLQMGDERGLLYRTIRSAKGIPLTRDGEPKWWTSTRACRAVWDLDINTDRSLAEIARKAISHRTGYDLLRDLPVRAQG